MKPSVIVADNNEFYRKVLGDFYRELGFEVRVAVDGVEALEMLQARRPDLLLLDLIMPRFDGARLCAWVKGQEKFKDLPVIIFSGILADEIEDVETIRADAYIAKMPLDQVGETLGEVSRKLVLGVTGDRPILSGFERMYRREVVLELLQERKSSREILDSLSEGIVELSEDRRLLSTNSAFREITGLATSALISRPLEEVFPGSRPVVLSLFEELRCGSTDVATAAIHHEHRELQLKLHRLEPEPADGEAAAGEALGRGGLHRAVRTAACTTDKVRLQSMINSVGYTLLVEDITQRVKAEREREQLRSRLAQSEKMSAIGLFVSGAAHELNNPLTSVLGYSQLLLSRREGADSRKELEKIAAGASRCKAVLENLMSFARANRPAKIALDFNALLHESLSGFADRFREAGAEVSLGLAPALPQTLADPGQIVEAFNCILDNALKALAAFPGRRSLAVSSRVAKGRIVIEFSDSGPGIPGEIIGKVFEPFFTTRQVGQGSGLGLSVAYGVATAHAGRISARNLPGGGASVTLEFPVIAREHVVEQAPELAAGPAASDARRRHLLIIDDEAVVQELLVDILESEARRIDTASNGLEGLAKIRQRDYDLIILDLRMPDMTGQQVYEEISRRHPELLERLIFITADTATPDVETFLKRAGVPCLTKPFAIDAVLARVDALLGPRD